VALFSLLLSWTFSLVLANPFSGCLNFTPLDESVVVGVEMTEEPVNLVIDIMTSNLNGLGDGEE
jgi:hypothetical protein